MKKRTVKKVFIFFLIYLPLQYAAVGVIGLKYSEPWPAFVFPGFKSVYTTSGKVTITEPVFSVQNETGDYELDTKLLFEGVRESQRLGFLDTNFADSAKVNSLGKESRQWLKKRIEKSYPDLRNPLILKFQWFERTYRKRDGELALVSKTIANKFMINL